MNEQPKPVRNRTWTVTVDIVEEGDDETRVHAVLDTGEQVLESRANARRNPHDTPVPVIGEEFAVGRALVGLGYQLLRTGTVDAAADDIAIHSR
ncbi:dsRBD fold-containing protein [Streptacidiphilus monticola]|jgi:hypothetical protein|uniref:DsRBD fold-containing protein n=1 Tax=Streptacidiphilus monticola TaxID=2161674 RepID=A0ABW1G990_9ACTN